MYLPISIDLEDLIEEFTLDSEQSLQLSNHIIDRIAQEYTLKWENLVDQNLKQSRGEYKRAMSITQVSMGSGATVQFELSGRISPLAMWIEEGHGPFDEKPGFQRSDKVKEKKDGGWYLTIPFRWANPQAVADSGVFTNIMPKEIYNLARRNRVLKENKIPEQYRIPGVRKEINTPEINVPEYIHKTSLYEGLTRVPASSGREKRSQYMTWRRVSDKSDPNSWWNGGIEAKHLMDKALEESQFDRVADMAIDEFLQKL